MSQRPEEILERVVREDGRYPLEAFTFLLDGLRRAVRQVHGERTDPQTPSHVTGAQFCHALRDEAIERWGGLARTVLKRWNIHSTMDFGEMVYLLVNNGLMHKTEEDSLEDFRDVYDFEAAFPSAFSLDPEKD